MLKKQQKTLSIYALSFSSPPVTFSYFKTDLELLLKVLHSLFCCSPWQRRLLTPAYRAETAGWDSSSCPDTLVDHLFSGGSRQVTDSAVRYFKEFSFSGWHHLDPVLFNLFDKKRKFWEIYKYIFCVNRPNTNLQVHLNRYKVCPYFSHTIILPTNKGVSFHFLETK